MDVMASEIEGREERGEEVVSLTGRLLLFPGAPPHGA
jgi:hypothetical protein